MRNKLFAALGTKVAIGVGAVALAAGTAGAVVVMQPVSDQHVEAADVDNTTTTMHATTTTTVPGTTTTTDAPTTTTVKSHARAEDAKECDHEANEANEDKASEANEANEDHQDGTDDATKAEAKDHPDNFGARVSDDAKDCGVDGATISQAAHDKNDARKADDTSHADDSHRGQSGSSDNRGSQDDGGSHGGGSGRGGNDD